MKIRKIYLPHSLAELNFTEDQAHRLLPLIHRQLKKRGFYTGADDHAFNSETREAVLHFQESEGLPPTGLIDPVTYCRLQLCTLSEMEPAENTRRFVDHSLVRGNILITKSQRRLTLFEGNNPIRQYPVGIGKPGTPTPEGNYSIATKVLNPGGVLGSRWMGLNYDAYGIHGTNQPWLIGQMISHGCIRMHNANAEELFILVRIGTPVLIRQ
jgi:peptidoglycan hydrolase-like protein with peptidoglycan-binding domain